MHLLNTICACSGVVQQVTCQMVSCICCQAIAGSVHARFCIRCQLGDTECRPCYGACEAAAYSNRPVHTQEGLPRASGDAQQQHGHAVCAGNDPATMQLWQQLQQPSFQLAQIVWSAAAGVLPAAKQHLPRLNEAQEAAVSCDCLTVQRLQLHQCCCADVTDVVTPE